MYDRPGDSPTSVLAPAPASRRVTTPLPDLRHEAEPGPVAPSVVVDPVPDALPPRARWWWVAAIFLVTLVVYAAFTPRVLYYTNPPTGDQPFYLHTAISIVQDHDLDESNNYAEMDEQQYYPRSVEEPGRYPAGFPGILAPFPLPPHNGNTTNRPLTEEYSKHGLGLSALIVPGWIVGTQVALPFLNPPELDLPTGGWPGVAYQLNIVGALLAVQVFLLAFETTRRPLIALVVWATLAFSNPQMTYSYLIFPELPAALCVVYAFRRIALGWQSNGPLRLVLIGVAAGFLPWLHARFLPIGGGLLLFAAWTWWRARRTATPRPTVASLLLAWLPASLSVAGLMGYYYWLYGTVLPNTGDHAGFIDPRSDPWGIP
ncbi:MAG TPA: hypothetical protein VM536_19960, partial [Chloroflexia bacterium]|nr:hypothetical protein [Chloroflexia bacterium]